MLPEDGTLVLKSLEYIILNLIIVQKYATVFIIFM